MTRHQFLLAVREFHKVLREATRAGVLDDLAGDIGPDAINAVCDGVEEMVKLERPQDAASRTDTPPPAEPTTSCPEEPMKPESPRILPTCTHVAAKAGLHGEGRRPCPQFPDTFLAPGNGYVALEWRGKELACVFPGNHVVVALPDGLPLPGVLERLAALLPDDADPQVDHRGGRPFAVATVGGTAYTLAPGSMFNFYPWAANEPMMLAGRLADFENAVAKARRLAGGS